MRIGDTDLIERTWHRAVWQVHPGASRPVTPDHQTGYGVAWLSGVLAAANGLYLPSRQHTRMDVAVVLASLYPLFTVLVAYALLEERISRAQWMGVGLCTAAIALIAVRASASTLLGRRAVC